MKTVLITLVAIFSLNLNAADYPDTNSTVFCYLGRIIADGTTTGGLTVSSVTTSLSDSCYVADNGATNGSWFSDCPSMSMQGGSNYSLTVTYSNSSTKTLSFTCGDDPNQTADKDKTLLSQDTTTVDADGAAVTIVTVQLLDKDLFPVAGKIVSLASSRGSTDTVTEVYPMTNDLGLAVFTVSSSSTGTATLTARDETESVTITTTGTASFVTPQSITKAVFTNSPLSQSPTTCGKMVLETQDGSSSAKAVTSNSLFALVSNSPTGSFYSDSSCTTVISTATVLNGQSHVDFYYKDAKKGTFTISTNKSPGHAWTPASQSGTIQ